MATLNAHDYTVGEILSAATMDGVTADLNAINTEMTASCFIESGTYTGNGSTGQTISLSDSSLVIKDLFIMVGGADGGASNLFWTTDLLADDDPQGLAIRIISAGTVSIQDQAIKSVGTGSFVVDDGGADNHPNQNAATYYYIARGTH